MPVQRETLLTRPGWFAASFIGTCALCGIRFDAGTAVRIAHSVDKPRPGLSWVAECCATPSPAVMGRRPPAVGLGRQPVHTCPGGCGRSVVCGFFACRADWYRLPYPLRRNIHQTYNRDAAAHAEAMRVAVQWYAQHRGVRS